MREVYRVTHGATSRERRKCNPEETRLLQRCAILALFNYSGGTAVVRRLVGVVGALALLAVVALSAVGLRGPAVVHAQGVATVDPGSGSVDDLFTFSVGGLTPGNSV